MEVTPEMNSPLYDPVMFDNGAKTIQWEKASPFNKWCWVRVIQMKKNETGPLPLTIYKS